MTFLTKEIVQQALEDNNWDITNTAKALNKPYCTIHWWVKKENFPAIISGINVSKEVVQELYDEHQSTRKVAKILGCTQEGVRMFMHREGLDVNKPHLCDVDHSFFSQENEKAFYWAGFLAADGCVVKRKNVSIVSLSLSINDLSHLEKYKLDLQSGHKIYIGKVSPSKLVPTEHEKCEIKFSSLQMANDLAKFNIKPRKSLIYKMPNWLLDHKLVHHFIRGYFDGDGSVWFCKTKKPTDQTMFAIFGGKELCTQVGKIINKNCNVILDRNIREKKTVYCVEYGGNGILSKIYDFLYKDATVYLERKQQKMIMSKTLSSKHRGTAQSLPL